MIRADNPVNTIAHTNLRGVLIAFFLRIKKAKTAKTSGVNTTIKKGFTDWKLSVEINLTF